MRQSCLLFTTIPLGPSQGRLHWPVPIVSSTFNHHLSFTLVPLLPAALVSLTASRIETRVDGLSDSAEPALRAAFELLGRLTEVGGMVLMVAC